MYELCNEEGHFNFQCSFLNDRIISQFCDNMITSSLYDKLNLFLGCEELSEKTSWLDSSTFGKNSILKGAYHYCVVNCRDNAYIAKIRKNITSPKYKRTNVSYVAN